MTPSAFIYSSGEDLPLLSELVVRHLPDEQPRSIVIKPNLVRHQEDVKFPIEALVTSSTLIDAVIETCLEKYSKANSILVGDAPLQNCDWDKLEAQAHLRELVKKYSRYSRPKVEIRDLRRERFKLNKGFLVTNESGKFGDPLGYYEVQLGHNSFLDPISNNHVRFRVSDYDYRLTEESHNRGTHRYLIAGSVLDADLIINLPKMKTHQKAGITGALKNIVGINGEKAFLVHYRKGIPRKGGDEFSPDGSPAIWLQVRMREFLQKRSKIMFAALRPGWKFIRKVYDIKTEGTLENLNKNVYIAGGAWYGNDTIWRMIYDLNKIVLYASKDGKEMRDTPQRSYLTILDGIVAGEGNGPLQPLPVAPGIIGVSNDPFIMDHVMARLMGFNYKLIPQLVHRPEFADNCWACFDPEGITIRMDGQDYDGISCLPIVHCFKPPPGWKDHIELEGCFA